MVSAVNHALLECTRQCPNNISTGCVGAVFELGQFDWVNIASVLFSSEESPSAAFTAQLDLFVSHFDRCIILFALHTCLPYYVHNIYPFGRNGSCTT